MRLYSSWFLNLTQKSLQYSRGYRFIISTTPSVVLKIHRKQFIICQYCLSFIKQEKVLNSSILIAHFFVAATRCRVVRVKLSTARLNTDVRIAPNQEKVVVGNWFWVGLVVLACCLLLDSECLLVLQTENVAFLELNVWLRYKSWFRVSGDYLAVPDLHKQNNKRITVNISVERLFVVFVKPIKRFGGTDSSLDILFKIVHEPFEVFPSWVVKNVPIKVLEVFSRWVLDDLFVKFDRALSLFLCLFESFCHMFKFWLKIFVNQIFKFSDSFSFFLIIFFCIIKFIACVF